MNEPKLANGEWRNEMTISAWDGNSVVIGKDIDGDLGIIDSKGYSIIIEQREVQKLRDWLSTFIERSEQFN